MAAMSAWLGCSRPRDWSKLRDTSAIYLNFLCIYFLGPVWLGPCSLQHIASNIFDTDLDSEWKKFGSDGVANLEP
jgi:hypothetical protein